jgi:hypothetical protein
MWSDLQGMYTFNRYYDPATDQFLSVDPALAQTGQPYAFTGDDPLNATDPLGDKRVYMVTDRHGRLKYVGQAGDRGNARRSAHLRSGQYNPKSKDVFEYLRTGSLSDLQATGVEQRIIEQFGLKNIDNMINAAGNPSKSTRWTYTQVVESGYQAYQANPDALGQVNEVAGHSGVSPEYVATQDLPAICGRLCPETSYIGMGSPGEPHVSPQALSAYIGAMEFRFNSVTFPDEVP